MMPPVLPDAIRRTRVSREQFITSQHYEAWLLGMPLRRHLAKRKKFSRDERELFRRHHEYLCGECGARTNLTIDHIVPQILGGSSRDCNLRYLCAIHNVAAWHKFAQYLRLYDQYLAEIAA